MKRNPYLQKLKPLYLFAEVEKKVQQFLHKYPDKKLISLAIGDTTSPLPSLIGNSFHHKADLLQTKEGYQGYGPSQGDKELRESISSSFYQSKFSVDEVFISDGAKPDLARLGALFGPGRAIALQDPSYPVYIDSALLFGSTEIVYLPCTQTNNFFPDFSQISSPIDLIYFCSPNNPTGIAATYTQLEALVNFAKYKKAIIIYDAAYSPFIQQKGLPRSIYEIPGSEEVAIEVHSFSKLIGFTGIRLGWSVVPHALKYENGESVNLDWKRMVSTLFNGASLLSQEGGKAALTPEGLNSIKILIDDYLKNTHLLRNALQKKGYTVYGGEHAPYLWVATPFQYSWNAFDFFLDQGLIVTPGSGFGSSGEGFVRLTGFGDTDMIKLAAKRIENASLDP